MNFSTVLIGFAAATSLPILFLGLGLVGSSPGFGPNKLSFLVASSVLFVLGLALTSTRARAFLAGSPAQPLRVFRTFSVLACFVLSVRILLFLTSDAVRLTARNSLDAIILPALAASFLIALAFLPRVIRINLSVFLALLSGGELFAGAWIYLRNIDVQAPVLKQWGNYFEGYFRFDPILGYRPGHEGAWHSARSLAGALIYDATYTIDSNGWRKTPPSSGQKSGFIAFFGDSFTFGEGVEDDETMPAQFEARLPQVRAYNFGFHGYGPQSMLATLTGLGVEQQIAEPAGLAVFTFLDGHIERLKGSMVVHNGWGDRMPYYRLSPSGELEFAGDFTSGRPLASRLYPLLGQSNILKLTGWYPGSRESGQDYLLAAKLLSASCDEFKRRFVSKGCVVLIYPGSYLAARNLVPELKKERVAFLDYSAIWDGADQSNFRLAGDGHPSAMGHRYVAQRLVADLELLLN